MNNCEKCGKQFIPPHKNNANKFCSRECYWDSKRKRVTRTCIECGKAYQALSTKKTKFCSRRCFYKNVGRNSIDVPCKTCGKIIHIWRSKIYPSGNIYCSRKCAAEATKKPGCRETVQFKLNSNIRRAIGKSLNGNKRGRRWESLVGYTIVALKKHLEKLFIGEMSWNNYGVTGWHIDHRIPKSAFNFTKARHTDFKRCWALSNLQPMWYKENISKGKKLSKPFQPSLLL